MALSFPEEVLEHIFSFLESNTDRNSFSLVCKYWHRVDRWCRYKIFIGNCYAVNPSIVIRRFPKVRSVTLKGKPHFADFDLVPHNWGGHVYPWIEAMAKAYPWLEELRLKRMVVTDESLELISRSFKNFRVLVLVSCEGFSTDGLAAIASNCRNLTELDLQENDVDERTGPCWLSHFPESFNSLVSLNIAYLELEMNSSLERLVSRCTNLRTLRFNLTLSTDRFANMLGRLPKIFDLGTGSFLSEYRPELFSKLASGFAGSKELKNLSGLWQALPSYIPAIYSVCDGLKFLNLSYTSMESSDLIKLICQCRNLKKLWVMGLIEDTGLEAVADSCKNLRELRVFPSVPDGIDDHLRLTEQGLVAVSAGCSKLESVLYFCHQMTNEALFTIARNRPNLTRFRLCIIEPRVPDYQTQEPFDKGFGAIVKSCRNLRRLSLSGHLTDRVFEDIGTYAKRLEMLSVAFAGDSDLGLHHILFGCESLRKLEIRDCPFGDRALLDNAAKLKTMRSLWMSSCFVSYGACKLLAQMVPGLIVEVIDETRKPGSRSDSSIVEKLYVYRSLAGPRTDAPDFVWTM